MKRVLFCELCPWAYDISVFKCRLVRRIKNMLNSKKLAHIKSDTKLPEVIYSHKSIIRRTLGATEMYLQENKAVNLAIAAPKVDGVIIRPGEEFSFWHLVGKVSTSRGYKEGLTITNSNSVPGVGGGMCQFTNLTHWMVLHTPLEITEHHHHDGYDLFPDFKRNVPFGTGTSITYNYLDYRFKNTTDMDFQLCVYVDDTHLCGELRAERPIDTRYDIFSEGEHFVREDGVVYRKGKVYRTTIDKSTGQEIKKELIRENHAKVMYNPSGLEIAGESK